MIETIRVVTVAALVSVASGRASAQASHAPQPDSTAQIVAFEKDWADAEVHHDRAALDRILDDAFVATFANGKTVDKAGFLKAILGMKIDSMVVAHDLIRVHDDIAVVVERFGAGLTTKVTWVAWKRDGRWRVIAEQMAALPVAK